MTDDAVRGAASGFASVTSGDPGLSRWPCPATSSREVGRIRTASGVCPWKSAVGAPPLPEAPRDAPAARGEGVELVTGPG
jgi:hypothetical protein